jgi:hypothetical protein
VKKLKEIPKGEDEILAYYGHPDTDMDGILDGEFLSEKVSIFDLPPDCNLCASWAPHRPITRFQAHKLVGDVIVDAEQEIRDELLKIEQEPSIMNHHREWGGTFNFRPPRGQSWGYSTHAYGIAVDRNPKLGPLDWQAWKIDRYPNRQSAIIISAYHRRGFVSLPWDMMHFQACVLPLKLKGEKGIRYERHVKSALNAWKSQSGYAYEMEVAVGDY